MTGNYSVVDEQVDGRAHRIRVRDYIPRQSVDRPLLWVHGGGFTSGGLDQRESDAPARAIAASGRWVRTVDYRLVRSTRSWRAVTDQAAVNRYPAAHHDVVDVAEALQERCGDGIFIGGASAGANLAAGAALALRDAGATFVAGLVLAYGAFHAQPARDAEIERELRGPLARVLFNPKMMRRINLNYVGHESLLAPGYAFPGGADLAGMPAALVLDARNDRLRCSGHAFAGELRRACVPVEEHVLEDWHGFLDRPRRAAFAQAIRLIRGWLD